MSTLKMNITARRIAQLTLLDQKIIHIKELALLWGITNPNSLRMTLKRYTEAKLLYRIQRGFYSLISLEKLDPLALGAAYLHRFCYLSTESILYQEGFLSQTRNNYTFVSEKSLKFTLAGQNFLSRQLKKNYLYHSTGVYEHNKVWRASTERAIADLLYFNPHQHFDAPVDWLRIQNIQKKIGYPLTPQRYDHS